MSNIDKDSHSEQVAEMSAQLVQKEQVKKQLEIKMDEVQKEKSSLESKLEEDRRTFEKEMQKMIDKQKQSEVGMSVAAVYSNFNALLEIS